MDKIQFLGIKVVNGTASDFDITAIEGYSKSILYLVRTREDKLDGYLHFNGKKYASGKDTEEALETYIGTVPTGYTTVLEYVQALISEKNVDAEGDGYITVSATNNKVSVKASDTLVSAITKADSAVQSISASGDTLINASADNKDTNNGQKVNVSATNELTTAVNNANSALQSISATGDTFVTASADTKSNSAQTVHVGVTTKSVSDATDSDNGLAVAKDVKDYVDGKVASAVTEVTYDATTKKIQLSLADGTKTTGFDASAFIKDGMLDSAELVTEYSGETGAWIHLVFNTDAEKEDIYIDVKQLIDTYTVADDSKEFMSISGNTITLDVDNSNSEDANSLASTDYVESHVSSAITEAIGNLDSEVTVKDENEYVEVTFKETDGKITESGSSVTVKTQTLGNAVGLTVKYKDADGNISDTKDETHTIPVYYKADGTVTTNGLAVASDVADEIVADEEVVASALNDHEDRIKSLETASTVTDAIKNLNATGTSTNGDYVNIEVVESEGKITGATVTETDALKTAVNNANSAVQQVNEKTGTAVTIDTTDVKMGTALTATTATAGTADATVNTVLNDIYNKLGATFTGSTSTASSVTITETTNGQNIEVNRETSSDATVTAGHIALLQDSTSGGLYGMMYYSGDDIEA